MYIVQSLVFVYSPSFLKSTFFCCFPFYVHDFAWFSPGGINRVHLISSYIVLILACWLISTPPATTLQCFARMSFLFSLYFLISFVRLWYTLKSLTHLHFPVVIGHECTVLRQLPLSPHCKKVLRSLQGVFIFPRLHAFPCSLLLPCLFNQWLNATERRWMSAYRSL